MMKKKKDTLCVVKRHGHTEAYDERKVYASIYAAALNCEHGERQSEKLASGVSKKITVWVKKSHGCVTSHVIREYVAKHIKDKNVRLMYQTHLDLS